MANAQSIKMQVLYVVLLQKIYSWQKYEVQV